MLPTMVTDFDFLTIKQTLTGTIEADLWNVIYKAVIPLMADKHILP